MKKVRSSQGSALVIVLSLVVVVTLIVVSALGLTLFDGRLATNALENQRAEIIGRVALDDLASKLAKIPLNRHWAAAPGRIRYWDGGNWQAINLYSEGNVSDQVDLNARLSDGSYAILPQNDEYPSAPEMKVSWNYVLEDGQIITDPANLPKKGVVGRFAYWTDIENGRININTAGFGMTDFKYYWNPFVGYNESGMFAQFASKVLAGNPWMSDRVDTDASGLVFSPLSRKDVQSKTPQNLVGHPSSMDLSFLDGVTEDESFNTFRYAGSYFLRTDAKISALKPPSMTPWVDNSNVDLSVHFFNTPEDWKLVVGDATYNRNKGYITTRGRTPEITPWGLPKIALGLVAKEGNVLNIPTEDYSQKLEITTSENHMLEDTRTVQVAQIKPYWSAPDRRTLRDLAETPSWAANDNAARAVLSTVSDALNVRFPGYSKSLSEKYNSYSPGEADQVTQEIVSFLDGSLNGYLAGFPVFVGQTPDDLGKRMFSGRLLPMLATSGTRRIGTFGQFLVNEIALQAQSASLDDAKRTYAVANVPAGITLPKAMLSVTEGTGGTALFLLRPPVDGDRFISLVCRVEAIIPSRLGFAQMIQQNANWQGRVTDLICDYESTDPASGSGTLRFNWDSPDPRSSPSTGPDNGLATVSPLGVLFQEANPANLVRPASGNQYAEIDRWGWARILVGPFVPGTTVTLKFRMRYAFSDVWSNGFGTSVGNTRIWSLIPGIFQDFADASDLSSEKELLEFKFPSLSVDSLLPTIVSYEADDPRVTRRASDWHLASSDSMGFQNACYTGGTNGNDSDLARPNSFLQTLRGRARAAIALMDWNSAPYGERQTASKILGLPGVGYSSSIPTGVDSGRPWQTMKFFANSDDPPDWLLWNLFYVPFDRSVANQTDGKLNINATLYPFNIQRKKPLEALLGNRISNPATLAANIADRNGVAPLGGPSDMYVYNGQICQIAGVADSGADEYAKETLVRDIADIVTTQSDDFRAFIVAQPVRQTPDGKVIPVTTQRIEATLSRSVDLGEKGYAFAEPGKPFFKVYGRGAYNSSGAGAPLLDFDPNNYFSGNGADKRPDTADDWLIAQKLEISSYRTIK